MKENKRIIPLVLLILITGCMSLSPLCAGELPDDAFKTYTNNDAHFSMKLPVSAVEKNSGTNRITWEYVPATTETPAAKPTDIPAAKPTDTPAAKPTDTTAGAASPSVSPSIIIRINFVFPGIAIDSEEYIRILQDTKKSDGMKITPLEIKNGNGFIYRGDKKESDDDTGCIYFVAASREGWICTVSVVGKWSLLRREKETTRSVLQSFEFLPVRKK